MLIKKEIINITSSNWRNATEENVYESTGNLQNIKFLQWREGRNKSKKRDLNKIKFYFIHEHDKFTTVWIKSYLLALAMGAYCRTQSKWMEHGKRNTNSFHHLEKRNQPYT